MQKSDSINELAAALSKAQAKIRAAPKDNVARVETSKGPGYSYHYSTLADVWEACREALSANGLAVVQLPAADGNKVTIATLLAHTSGQWVADELTLVARDASPQAIGSCITYGRRYALGSMVGVVSEEDDDGQAAQPRRPVGNGHGNGNGPKAPAQPPPDAAEKLSIEIREGLEGGFASLDEKLRWKQVNRDRINALPPAYRQAIVAAYEAAPVNP